MVSERLPQTPPCQRHQHQPLDAVNRGHHHQEHRLGGVLRQQRLQDVRASQKQLF